MMIEPWLQCNMDKLEIQHLEKEDFFVKTMVFRFQR